MATIREEERWASKCISSALGGVPVTRYDDGSQPGMYDLKIVYPGRSWAAVEVTAAADAESIELWNLINGRGRWVEPDLAGGWSVGLRPGARVRRLRAELPILLRLLEELRVREVRRRPSRRGPFEAKAHALGITRLFQCATDFRGSIYPTIDLPGERSGGWAATTGDPLVQWLDDWIRQVEQAHNLEKLRTSGADERHLLIVLPGFATAPFQVMDLLWRDDAPLPTVAPVLPTEVTHIWAMSTSSSGSGMRWSPDAGWAFFEKGSREDGRVRVG